MEIWMTYVRYILKIYFQRLRYCQISESLFKANDKTRNQSKKLGN